MIALTNHIQHSTIICWFMIMKHTSVSLQVQVITGCKRQHISIHIWKLPRTTQTMFTFTYIWSQGTNTYPSCMFLSIAFQTNVVGLFNYNTEGRWRACKGKFWRCVSFLKACCKWTSPQSECRPSECSAGESCWSVLPNMTPTGRSLASSLQRCTCPWSLWRLGSW